MSCYNPLIAWKTKKGTKAEFVHIKSSKEKIEYLNYQNKNYQYLPCRKCIGCKLDNAKEWAVRTHLQTKYTKNNYFITLTYSNGFIPKNKNGHSNLNYDHLKKFIKDIRNHWKYNYNHQNIKYLASGEYGSKYKRAHFHICFFNLPINDLIKMEKSKNTGQQLYMSATINKIWKKGMHKIGIVTMESGGYTARYTTKKATTIDYENLKINPEKLWMSKGIGIDYFKDHYKEIYEHDYIPIKSNNVKPPKYYDRLLEKIDDQQILEIKAQRMKIAEQQWNLEKEHQKKPFAEILADKQRQAFKKQKQLKRNLKNEN